MKQLKRDLLRQLIPVAIIGSIAAVLLATPALAAKHDPACSVNPGSVSSGQSYTVSALGLPGGNDNLVITVPDGTQMTSAINPSNGNWSGSYTAPSWNNETGTYTYRFVGKVTWPAGTFSQVYATCSVQVG